MPGRPDGDAREGDDILQVVADTDRLGDVVGGRSCMGHIPGVQRRGRAASYDEQEEGAARHGGLVLAEPPGGKPIETDACGAGARLALPAQQREDELVGSTFG